MTLNEAVKMAELLTSYLLVPVLIVSGISPNGDFTKEILQSTGKDWTDLASAILQEAWTVADNKTSVNVFELMGWFNKVGGEDRLNLIRILEVMDKDMNGELSQDEFIAMYASPMTSPENAIGMMYKLYDLDGNGYISIWELLTRTLTIDGINRNVLDKYKETQSLMNQMDSNSDKILSPHEFNNYVLWGLYYGLSSGTPPKEMTF